MSKDLDSELQELELERMQLVQRIGELRRSRAPKKLEPHVLVGPDGARVPIAELFDDKNELLVIHNMGKSCSYCTLWADGLNGVLPHLQSRCPTVLVSPDAPAVQAEFAASRGWDFRTLSDADGKFSEALGFKSGRGFLPGCSTLRRTAEGEVEHVASAPFGPGDEFCAVFHLFDMLPEGQNGWQPRYAYD